MEHFPGFYLLNRYGLTPIDSEITSLTYQEYKQMLKIFWDTVRLQSKSVPEFSMGKLHYNSIHKPEDFYHLNLKYCELEFSFWDKVFNRSLSARVTYWKFIDFSKCTVIKRN